MKIPAGDLDRRVTILQPARTRDATLGTDVIGFAPLDEVWARVRPVLPAQSEAIAEGISFERRPKRVWIRWRDDVDATMRLAIDGEEHEIVAGPIELGRKDGLELIAEYLSTEGQQP